MPTGSGAARLRLDEKHIGPTALFVVVMAVGGALAIASIGNPWFWDDLHTIRPYSASELGSVWHGPYDPDQIETPGYRPLQTLSNYARLSPSGQSPDANRYLTLAIAALAFALLAAALVRLGAPVALPAAAALIELTSKNFTYTYAWSSVGYHALQMAAFAAALLALAIALTQQSRRRLMLGTSLAWWAVALLVKDQGVVLMPVLLVFMLLPSLVGDAGDGKASAFGYGAAARAAVTGLKALWGQRAFRLYAVGAAALAVADLALRGAFVSGAPSDPLGLHSYLTQVKETIALAGPKRSLILYCAFGMGLLLLVLLAPRVFGPRPPRRVGVSWVLALFGALSSLCTAAFGVLNARSALVFFPLWFYALFLSGGAVLLLEFARRSISMRRLAVAMVAAVAVFSLARSVPESVRLQEAMGEWSVQTLGYDYDLVYGSLARSGTTIPAGRRTGVEARLRRVGIRGQIPGDGAFALLYCAERADPALPTIIPRVYAWEEDDFISLPRCRGSKPARSGR